MKKVLLILALVVTASVSANADTITITPAEAASLNTITSNAGGAVMINQGNGRYTVGWQVEDLGVQQFAHTVNFAPRGAAGDTFQVTVQNENENTWDFQICVSTGQCSAFVTLAPDGSNNTLSIAGLTGPVSSFTLVVRGVLPRDAQGDRTAEYILSPQAIPEPASLLLLGTGLAGAAGAIRRRFGKTE